MIYTSYFAKMNKIAMKDPSAKFFGITRYSPRWFKGPNYSSFGPTAQTLSKYKIDGDQTAYTKEYKDRLSKLNKQATKEFFIEQSKDCNLYLLCYERSTDFCHRHIFADYLISIGIPCEEWKDN